MITARRGLMITVTNHCQTLGTFQLKSADTNIDGLMDFSPEELQYLSAVLAQQAQHFFMERAELMKPFNISQKYG